MPTKNVSKSDAFKALENILDNAMTNAYQKSEDIITITRFIEQQYEIEEAEEKDGTKLRAEGTL